MGIRRNKVENGRNSALRVSGRERPIEIIGWTQNTIWKLLGRLDIGS